VEYTRDAIPELDLAYAITIHKSQESEFEAVIIPVLTQHFKMLFRNLIYTGLTGAKNLSVPYHLHLSNAYPLIVLIGRSAT
jgi:exodeoxyribonuclease V alpha subunit